MSSKDRREGPVISWLRAIQPGAAYVLFLWQETVSWYDVYGGGVRGIPVTGK